MRLAPPPLSPFPAGQTDGHQRVSTGSHLLPFAIVLSIIVGVWFSTFPSSVWALPGSRLLPFVIVLSIIVGVWFSTFPSSVQRLLPFVVCFMLFKIYRGPKSLLETIRYRTVDYCRGLVFYLSFSHSVYFCVCVLLFCTIKCCHVNKWNIIYIYIID